MKFEKKSKLCTFVDNIKFLLNFYGYINDSVYKSEILPNFAQTLQLNYKINRLGETKNIFLSLKKQLYFLLTNL